MTKKKWEVKISIDGWSILGRKKKFYKKDKQGFYFIPEVLEEGKM